MKIVTYNIWNYKYKRIERFNALCEELNQMDADIVALQEVSSKIKQIGDKPLIEEIVERTNYQYYSFENYPECEEGLAFLSKYPIELVKRDSFEISDSSSRVIIKCEGIVLGVTNVHLTYECPLRRENQIVEIVDWINRTQKEDSYEILLGDFNSHPHSSVYNYLLARCSLNQTSTKLGWLDLHASYASYHKKPLLPTLDFYRNPRWHSGNENHMEIPVRYDWILLKNLYPKPYPEINRVELFGEHPTKTAKVVPSDHYGVFVDLTFNS